MPPRQLALVSAVFAVILIYFAYKSAMPPSSVSASFTLGASPSASVEIPNEILVSANDGSHLLLQLDMSYYKRAVFDIGFQDMALDGWCVHLGDAPGNDGWGGDDGQFSNNAEFQLSGQGGAMALFGNDTFKEQPDNSQGYMMMADLNLVAPKSRLQLTIKDGALYWDNFAGKKGGKESPYLFALNGQPDAKHGGPNDAITFAAFNRLIGNAGEVGTCVNSVQVTLYNQ